MKDKPYIKFYVAECEEFHNLGKYYDNLDLVSAVNLYKELRANTAKANYGNSLGFTIHDDSLDIYNEINYPIVMDNSIQGDLIELIEPFANHPLILKAVEDIANLCPEYDYIPIKNNTKTRKRG